MLLPLRRYSSYNIKDISDDFVLTNAGLRRRENQVEGMLESCPLLCVCFFSILSYKKKYEAEECRC